MECYFSVAFCLAQLSWNMAFSYQKGLKLIQFLVPGAWFLCLARNKAGNVTRLSIFLFLNNKLWIHSCACKCFLSALNLYFGYFILLLVYIPSYTLFSREFTEIRMGAVCNFFIVRIAKPEWNKSVISWLDGFDTFVGEVLTETVCLFCKTTYHCNMQLDAGC